MKTVYILKGLPASGKSTWAKKKIKETPGAFKRINKDDLRAMLDDNYWSKGNEQFILSVRDWLIKRALHDGKHVISDDTNLAPFHEERIRTLVNEFKKETGQEVAVQVKFFDLPIEECIKRDLKRDRSVGERVIRSMYNKFINPVERNPKPLEQDAALPRAIICDLDGTLAILNRNPFDASLCEQDLLNVPIANMVKTYKQLGYSIILVSGRQQVHQPQTERWLAKHEIAYDALFLRVTEDIRKDAVVKKEIFYDKIYGRWFIEFVLDDRNQVVEMWRAEGLTCCQVAPGDF